MDVIDIQKALNALGYGPLSVDGVNGPRTKTAIKRFQSMNSLMPDGVVGRFTQLIMQQKLAMQGSQPTLPQGGTILTAAIVRKTCPFAKAELIAPIENNAALLTAVGIDTPLVAAHFLAQVAAETGGLHHIEENLNYTTAKRIYDVFKGPANNRRFANVAECQPYVRNPQKLANKVYGGRLGNVNPNDGWDFRGGGYLHTTGRHNYRKAGYENNPQALREPQSGLEAALKFWRDNNITPVARRDDVVAVRKIINGGTNGLDDAKAYLAKAKRALGI